MSVFWILIFLSGTIQIVGVCAGFKEGIDIKFLLPWGTYAVVNAITGWLGI